MKVLFMLLVGLLVCNPMGASADYSDGLDQYLRGQYSNALNEFTPLANKGNPDAQYILGSMYAQGKGVLQDYAQAHAWFNLAASQGHEKAALYRDEIAQKMTFNQVARAQQLASQRQSETRTGETKRIDKNLIVSIQKHLQDLGYYSGAIDGLTGRNTSRSIRQFQRDVDLSQTGQPSHALLETLEDTVTRQTEQRKSSASQGSWTTVLLEDAFTDGDFSTNPGWTPVSGNFWVDSNYFLRSERAVSKTMQSDQPDSAEKRIADIFGQVVKEMMNPQQGTQASNLSELYIQQRIDNAFAIEVTMKMLSNQVGQSFEFRTYHDQYRNSGYVVKFLQENEQSLALIRFDPSGSSVIDMTRPGRMFRQNELQSFSWMRYADGEMKVMIGKDEVLNTKDNMFKAFDGISFINEGGDYAVDRIRVLGSHR
ncbi:SEL1-like repeat protein [Desulfotignum balticum]|uniref:SEL1-like repeat protein n=1 Tax=Desulfotignum balticum TaxID=115781 RepID=UPI00040A5F19|nr:SEL1-like repeat protein [Desulfotignum balticum]